MSPLRADHMSFESGQWKQKFFSQPSASEVMISEECFSTPENMCADSANGKVIGLFGLFGASCFVY